MYKDVSPRSSLFEMKTELKVDGKLGWNDFQIVMSRSTTPDLIKMCGKLQDFFNQQQRSGMHAFAEKRQLTVTSSFPLSRPGNRIVNKREFGATDKRDDTNEEQQSDGQYLCDKSYRSKFYESRQFHFATGYLDVFYHSHPSRQQFVNCFRFLLQTIAYAFAYYCAQFILCKID